MTSNSKETFDMAQIIYKVASILDWNANPKEIEAKVKQLQRGLPKEDQFAALCLWMGNCSLIHKLEQEQFPSLSKEKYQVPDFIAVLNVSGKDIPVLVEVKKTKDIKIKSFSSAYHGKITNYANLLQLPLLIAWHIESFNLWCFFDIRQMQKKRTAFHIDFNTAMNNNLLGVLFDDVIFRLKPGNKILIRVRKEHGSEMRDSSTGELKRFSGIVEEIRFVSAKNQDVVLHSKLGKLFELLFHLVDNDQTDEEDKEYVTLTFYTTNEDNRFTHQLLSAIAFEANVSSYKSSNWLEVIKKNRFGMDFKEVQSALSEGVKKGVVTMIVRQNPAIRPKFLENMK